MIEVIVIIALLALLAWEKYQSRLERAKYLNAILGKNAHEIASLNLSDKTKIVADETKPEGLVPETDLSDKDFLKQIDKENSG